MMRRSDTEGCLPFKLASMTRRQMSATASSLRSVAASRTVRAASSVPSCFDGSTLLSATPLFLPKVWGAALPNAGTALPNGIAFMLVGLHSWHGKRGLPLRAGLRCFAILARLIEGQNAPRCLDVEAAILAFQVSQILRGDAMVLGAEKQQGHHRLPGEIEGLGKDQQRFTG